MGILTREQRKDFRDDLRAAKAANGSNDSEEIDEIREIRSDLRRQLRAERRARGEAPDQVIVRTLADVWDEEKASEFVREDLTDIAVHVLEGELTFDQAVEEALDELAEDADDLLNFGSIPVVGAILELVDGMLFRMFLRDTLRPWIAERLREILPGD